MTKNEERKVLAQIKKLIDSTGTGSYISIAFEGCVEKAETNIDNDWACSYYQIAHKAEGDANKLYQENAKLQANLNAANQSIEILKHDLEEIEKKAINSGIYKRVWLALEQDVCEAQEKMTKLANLFADMADQNPTEDAMRQIMQSMAKAKKELLEASSLLKAFEKYEN